MQILPEFGKVAVKALVQSCDSLAEVQKKIWEERERQRLMVSAKWDEMVKPVKVTLDALPEALRVKGEADKMYAKEVAPIWESYDHARDLAKEFWDELRGS